MSGYKSGLSKYLAQPESQKEPAVVIPCEYLNCPDPAIVRVKDGYILRTMCRKHYDLHFQRAASDYARGLGLDTTEKKKAYCSKMLKLVGNAQPSKAWAGSLKTDYLDGVALEYMQIQMASGALNEEWKTVNGRRVCVPLGEG